MNRYQTSSPRAVISTAAAAMTALTLGLTVLPAQTNGGARQQVTAQEVSQNDIAPVDVAARDGSPIVVYGFRDAETGLRKVGVPHVTPPQKHQS